MLQFISQTFYENAIYDNVKWLDEVFRWSKIMQLQGPSYNHTIHSSTYKKINKTRVDWLS